ncbi:putative aldo-keto reductase [Rhizodiscina lignyota]|uniref:Aldo-keto reductase n=1 Tax=Rhizodiscina lignyota TaxID=1504668 RepID=A0A9P4MAI0_9PEZI|nr:putative aldo-keto reductase [Rhizodiscina lignyota]
MAPPTLPTHQLGKDGPQVTAIGYGMMGLSANYGAPLPDDQRFALLDKIYEAGELFWDSSDSYGDSEVLIGRWFAQHPERRKDIFLCTKFGQRFQPDGSRAVDSSPAWVRQACENSLKKMGVDTIDLWYSHRQDKKTPIEQTVRAMDEMRKEGKVRYLGLSECSANSLRRACKAAKISAVQLEYSPFSLEIESEQIDLLRTARELGVAVVAYSPVGRGMLTGTITSPDQFEPGDFRARIPRFSKENFHKNIELVDNMKKIAQKKGCTPAQLALAWVLAQGKDVIPIPGTTKFERFEENMGALKVKLTPEEVKEIRDMAKACEPEGDRYPDFMMGHLFADTPEEA